jgi:acyl-coenzyme A thioesterase PaaI-like protein
MVFPRSVLVVGATSKTLLRLVKGRPDRRCQASVSSKLTDLRPLSVKSGTISAEGKAVKLGRQTSYAEGFVHDGAGNLAVHATATFSMIGHGEINAAFKAEAAII